MSAPNSTDELRWDVRAANTVGHSRRYSAWGLTTFQKGTHSLGFQPTVLLSAMDSDPSAQQHCIRFIHLVDSLDLSEACVLRTSIDELNTDS